MIRIQTMMLKTHPLLMTHLRSVQILRSNLQSHRRAGPSSEMFSRLFPVLWRELESVGALASRRTIQRTVISAIIPFATCGGPPLRSLTKHSKAYLPGLWRSSSVICFVPPSILAV